MPTPKQGPLTPAELQKIWESTSDPGYWQPFEQAGEGNGFEAHTQAWQQHARVSQAVDATTQAMYLLPWSGQSAPPASGPKKATVTLTLTRTGLLNLPLVLQAGQLVEELQTDWGDAGGVPVLTGRRYALLEAVVFEPGQQGPIQVTAQAERPGYGYNNPLPGSIQSMVQNGAGYSNTLATVRGLGYPSGFVAPGFTQQVLVDCQDQPDTFLPDHVGQYLLFTAGANAGTTARISGYMAPRPPGTGGTVQLELEQCCIVSGVSGQFQAGEVVQMMNGAAVSGYGVFVDLQVVGSNTFLLVRVLCGAAVTGFVGQQSGATATLVQTMYDPAFTPEVQAASWRILDWVADWGLACTNAQQPTGGAAAMLDAIGKERNAPRGPGESDDAYRVRLAQLGDTVSPNAIQRVLNRAAPGQGWLFLEAGTTFQGFFFDHDAWDYDLQVVAGAVSGAFHDGELVQQNLNGRIISAKARVQSVLAPTVPGPPGVPIAGILKGFAGFKVSLPFQIPSFGTAAPIVGMKSGASLTPTSIQGRLQASMVDNVWVDYLHMRAWFYVGAPIKDAGDPGFAWDIHPHGAYDTTSSSFACWDGQAFGDAAIYRPVAQALDLARAGGVGFDILPVDLSFDPSQQGTLLAAWDASQSIIDSARNVSTWPDLSGNGADAVQATANRRPQRIANDPILNGQTSIHDLTASNEQLVAPLVVSPPFTIYWVGYANGTANGFAFSTGSGTQYALFTPDASHLAYVMVSGAHEITWAGSVVNVPHVVCVTQDVVGNTTSLYVDAAGTPVGTLATPAGVVATGNITFLASLPGFANGLALIYQGMHSLQQRQNVMLALGARFKITVAP